MQGYLLTNLVNGKMYVGKTTRSIKRRWQNHCASAKRYQYTSVLHNAIRKYGAENFTIDPLNPCDFDITTEAELNSWECLMIRLIRKNRQLYNTTEGGEGARGNKHSEESKQKMSASHKRRAKTPGHRANIARGHLGIRPTGETRRKLSLSHQTKSLSQETRVRMSLGAKNRPPISDITRNLHREHGKIVCCTRWNIRRGKPCICGQHLEKEIERLKQIGLDEVA